jgi:predicted nucleic acid-binding protein
MNRVILDTGPLVAWFCPRDEHHRWARRVFPALSPGSLICEAVLTEVCHLVAKEGISHAQITESIAAGRLNVVSLASDIRVVAKLLRRYADTPMDFADACVVRLAELNSGLKVCTVDSHFQFFRKNIGEEIGLLAPFVG